MCDLQFHSLVKLTVQCSAIYSVDADRDYLVEKVLDDGVAASSRRIAAQPAAPSTHMHTLGSTSYD